MFISPIMSLPNPTPPRRLRIAVSGGGLAGATLMNALLKHPHLDPHIYESAAEFSERGAAVGLSINAQRALSEIGEPVRMALDKAGAVGMHSTRQVLVSCVDVFGGWGGLGVW